MTKHIIGSYTMIESWGHKAGSHVQENMMGLQTNQTMTISNVGVLKRHTFFHVVQVPHSISPATIGDWIHSNELQQRFILPHFGDPKRFRIKSRLTVLTVLLIATLTTYLRVFFGVSLTNHSRSPGCHAGPCLSRQWTTVLPQNAAPSSEGAMHHLGRGLRSCWRRSGGSWMFVTITIGWAIDFVN